MFPPTVLLGFDQDGDGKEDPGVEGDGGDDGQGTFPSGFGRRMGESAHGRRQRCVGSPQSCAMTRQLTDALRRSSKSAPLVGVNDQRRRLSHRSPARALASLDSANEGTEDD